MCLSVCVSVLPGAHSFHPIALRLLQVVLNMLAVVLEIEKNKKNCTSWSTQCSHTRSTHPSSDCDETCISCKHARNGFGKIKILKIILTGVPIVVLPGAHSFHPIALRLLQVVLNMLEMVLEI